MYMYYVHVCPRDGGRVLDLFIMCLVSLVPNPAREGSWRVSTGHLASSSMQRLLAHLDSVACV